MGFSEAGLVQRLNRVPGYRKQFATVFGTAEIEFRQVAHALAAFERTIFSGDLQERGTFKTPTLRDIALTAPYFHDGSAPTLEEVIDYYDRGAVANPQLNPQIGPLNLSPGEKRDLLQFLHSLTGSRERVVSAPELPQ